jgi:hypothetical protein
MSNNLVIPIKKIGHKTSSNKTVTPSKILAMEALGRLFVTLLVVGLSHELPLVEDQQSDTSVRQLGLLARLEAEINANKAEIKQMKDTLTGSYLPLYFIQKLTRS